MNFISLPFVVFFIAFFMGYWLISGNRLKLQNAFILAGSYLFYAYWDWRFLLFLVASSLLFYFLGIQIDKTAAEKKRKAYVFLGILVGAGSLLYFKYFNFFIENLIRMSDGFGIRSNIHTLKIILPLGISFFTFRSLSYLFEINKGKIEPTRDLVVFLSYISFFPSLTSGPIDKPNLLIPQFLKKRQFNYDLAVDGMQQILWGLFKKIVIADNMAIYSNSIFDSYATQSSSTLILGALYYTIQLYTDFSGYSDISIGIGKLLGFNITKNFNYPFFAQNVADYWRRWHMSLTTWVTDYVFTPLAIYFRDRGKTGIILAILINMLVVGVWHGANWTYVFYGLFHGLYFIPLIFNGNFNKRIKNKKGNYGLTLIQLSKIIGTFLLVMFTNVIFRSISVVDAFEYYKEIFNSSVFSLPSFYGGKTTLLLAFLMFFVEWFSQGKEFPLQFKPQSGLIARWVSYLLVVALLFMYGGAQSEFIYVQF